MRRRRRKYQMNGDSENDYRYRKRSQGGRERSRARSFIKVEGLRNAAISEAAAEERTAISVFKSAPSWRRGERREVSVEGRKKKKSDCRCWGSAQSRGSFGPNCDPGQVRAWRSNDAARDANLAFRWRRMRRANSWRGKRCERRKYAFVCRNDAPHPASDRSLQRALAVTFASITCRRNSHFAPTWSCWKRIACRLPPPASSFPPSVRTRVPRPFCALPTGGSINYRRSISVLCSNSVLTSNAIEVAFSLTARWPPFAFFALSSLLLFSLLLLLLCTNLGEVGCHRSHFSQRSFGYVVSEQIDFPLRLGRYRFPFERKAYGIDKQRF